jgi:hypothetical protein
MTRGSVLEYKEAVRRRYLNADKIEKGKILDEFVQVTGYHPDSIGAAIRLLRRGGSDRPGKRRGCRRRYGGEAVEALRKVWEASDCLCSKRLQPFIGELVRVTLHWKDGELAINARVEAELSRMSPSTIDPDSIGALVLLRKDWGGRHPLSTTKPGSSLKSSIPIHTLRPS